MVLDNCGQIIPEEEELMMKLSSAYLKKQQEWQEEGFREGYQEVMREIAIKLLREGMAVDFIAKVTGLPIAQIHQLQKQL